jgi:hypothetical protein
MSSNETYSVTKEDFTRVSQMMAGFLQTHGGEAHAMQSVARRAEAIQGLTTGDITLSEKAATRARYQGEGPQSAWAWTWPF